jgi:tRNA-dihydrouridine synthase A
MDKLLNYKDKIFAVAPMMDWTDRHCRFFLRQLSRSAVLYTEMVTARAVVHGVRSKLLDFDAAEQPLVLQLGGSEPEFLAQAAKIGEDWGYSAINLNVGCPSDRVQGGKFGACLMATPELVADCVAAMNSAVKIPVTVKCRIGIDDQDEDEDLRKFVETVAAAGCKTFVVHARKAWLSGLSPKENREVPPLNYARVHRLKKSRPDLDIHLNGGLTTVTQAVRETEGLDGVMLGRAAYHTPWEIAAVDRLYTDKAAPVATRRQAVEAMLPYISSWTSESSNHRIGLHRITRHMLGLYHGQKGGRIWRQILSTQVQQPGADHRLVLKAMNAVEAQE